VARALIGLALTCTLKGNIYMTAVVQYLDPMSKSDPVVVLNVRVS